MSETPDAAAVPLPAENVPRGTLLALLIIPAGILAWVLLWQFGVIASLVAFGIAIGGMWLYRLGSGGRISRGGAVRVSAITVVALGLAFLSGLVSDVLPTYADQRNLSWIGALTEGRFWEFLSHGVDNNLGDVMFQLLLALVFGVLGCFSVLRTASVQTATAPPPVQP